MTNTVKRPTLKHAMTTTAFAWITVKRAWKDYFTALGKAAK